MWLPHADELSSSTGFADECHNHPVLVLSKKMDGEGKVDILMVSVSGIPSKVQPHDDLPCSTSR